MYDKKKTIQQYIQQYIQGGYAKPMSYATGGYIPGLSSARYTAGLQRDKRIAMEEFEANAEKVAKEQKYRGLLGKVGSFAGTALGAALAAPTGGMSVLAGKALGSAIGKGAGELVGGSFVDSENLKKSSTGLYKDDFEYLKKQGREAQDLGELAKRSAISGATTYGVGKAAEVGGNMKNYFDGTKLDLGEIDTGDLFSKDGLARTTGIGGENYAETVTKRGLSDNPELVDEFLGGGMDIDDMLDSDFVDADFVDANAVRPDAILAEQYADSPADQAYESLQSRKQAQFDVYNKDPNSELIRGIDSNPLMSYEESLKGSNRLGKLNTTIADINESTALKNQLMDKSLNNIYREFSTGGVDEAQIYRDRSSAFAARLKRLLEPDTEEKKPFALLQGYAEGGKVEEYNQGGLIDMNSFSRRIL